MYMGNNIGGRKKAKIMKLDGETFKQNLPSSAMDVLQEYPGYVLLESEAVKKFGIRAEPLQPEDELRPNKVYFLVNLPKFPDEKLPRRSRSVVHTSARDRLECLMLKKRSVSDVSGLESGVGPLRVKMRVPRAEIERLMEESKDEAEVAEKIVGLCLKSSGHERAQLRPGVG